MKIAVFSEYGSINSKPVFDAFITCLQEKNENIVLNKYDESCDVAVIWSVLWSGRMQQNKKVWDFFKKQNKPVVVLEVGGIKRNVTWKMGINGINRDADFANNLYDNQRWPLFDIKLTPWKQTGDTIVICGQHEASHQWQGEQPMSSWIESQIQQIRTHTDKPIIIRPHPRHNVSVNEQKFKNVNIKKPTFDNTTYDDTDFKESLKSTWAVINHSSNPALESVFAGIPVFVSASSLCYDVGGHDISNILKPAMPERIEWANKLAYTEWTVDEIRQGTPWIRIRERLLEKYIK
jgi:hypothetical protein